MEINMEEFMAGKTNVSPLTGRMLKQAEANQLRAALSCDRSEHVGAFMVGPPNKDLGKKGRRKV